MIFLSVWRYGIQDTAWMMYKYHERVGLSAGFMLEAGRFDLALVVYLSILDVLCSATSFFVPLHCEILEQIYPS